jgi:hypothetical protein
MHRSPRSAWLAALLTILAPATAGAAPLPEAPGCALFPADNAWNARVDALPVAAGSDSLVTRMAIPYLHPDFSNAGAYGIPYNVVSDATPATPIAFDYADESDPGPYRIPSSPLIEGGSDAHVLLVNRDTCGLAEIFAARRSTAGAWSAGSGATWSLASDALRPDGWTSADAAGLPILPGLARADEVVGRGVIDHALRFTISRSQKAHLYPARHDASATTDPLYAPMGLRVRLKAAFDVSGFPTQTRVVLTALQRYGMIVADNGSSGFISGAPSTSWSDDDLHSLQRVPGTALEVVDTSSLPGTPPATVLNPRFTLVGSTERVRLLHSAAGALSMQALVGGQVVASTSPRSYRQGFLSLSMAAVGGASYRVVTS